MIPLGRPGLMTEQERFQFDTAGYLVIPGALSPEESQACLEAAKRLNGEKTTRKPCPSPKRLVEERENLFDAEEIFNQARVQVTGELLAYLKRLKSQAPNGYAWAIERQSLGVEAHGRLDHTGHIGRVRQCLSLARLHGLYLEPPVERPDREEGEPPFLFDDRVWFVDGEHKKATGFSLSPEIRPRLWTCYALLRQIHDTDPAALPRAIVIADEMRFMRADDWIKLWYYSIKRFGVDLIFPETGYVESMQLEMLAMKVRVMSENLVRYRQSAIQVAKAQGRILWNRPPFGLCLENGGGDVVAHPVEWPILCEVIEGLATGRFPTVMAASYWSRDRLGDGRHISDPLIRTWLKEGHYVEGIYEAYAHDWKACVIRQKHGNLEDYSFTANLNKRYVRTLIPEEQRLRKPILHRYGTAPIPPALLLEARARVRSRRGRSPDLENPSPMTNSRWAVVPSRVVRCAVCGSGISEHGPCLRNERDSAGEPLRRAYWACQCRCLSALRRAEALTREEVLADPRVQHTRYRRGSLSLALIDLLGDRLFGEEFDPAVYMGRIPADVEGERHALETKQARLFKQLHNLTGHLAVTDPEAEAETARSIRREMKEVNDAIRDVDRTLALLSAQTLERQATNVAILQARETHKRWSEERGYDPQFWKIVIQMFVESVVLDLETGEFTVTCRIRHPALQVLSGRLADGGR
jgi:hypothetical protein